MTPTCWAKWAPPGVSTRASASATSSSNVRGIGASGSECGVVEVHQRGRGAGQDAARRGDLGQHIGGKELRRGDLALVERLLFARCAGIQCSQRDFSVEQQLPADEQIAD